MAIQNFKLLFSLIGFSMVMLPDTAFAMTAREGFVACDKNPKCKADTKENGDVIFTGPGFLVECPQEGQCILFEVRTGTSTGKKLRPAKAKDLSLKAQ